MLEQLAWLASVVSAAAIVTSAIYASVQIRHNTRAVRASAFQQVIHSFSEISFDIAKDPLLISLYLRAGREFSSLNEVDRVQYSLLLLSFLRRAENVVFQSNNRLLAGEHWPGIRNSIRDVMAPPGARACWREIEDRLNPEFRTFIESLLVDPIVEIPSQTIGRAEKGARALAD